MARIRTVSSLKAVLNMIHGGKKILHVIPTAFGIKSSEATQFSVIFSEPVPTDQPVEETEKAEEREQNLVLEIETLKAKIAIAFEEGYKADGSYSEAWIRFVQKHNLEE
jgi:hypothetical protein